MAIDARTDMVSPTLVLPAVIARDLARRNAEEPRHSYLSWNQLLREPLARVAERHGLSCSIFLHNISPFWLSNLVQDEYNLDEQQVRLYVEAMERARVSETLACLLAVGLGTVYKDPSHVLQRLFLDKANACLFSFLEFAQNPNTWLYSLIDAVDAAGLLRLKA